MDSSLSHQRRVGLNAFQVPYLFPVFKAQKIFSLHVGYKTYAMHLDAQAVGLQTVS